MKILDKREKKFKLDKLSARIYQVDWLRSIAKWTKIALSSRAPLKNYQLSGFVAGEIWVSSACVCQNS